MDIKQTVIDTFTGQIGRGARAEDLISSYKLSRLAKVNICMVLDNTFGLSLDVGIVDKWKTVRDAYRYIEELGVW